LIDGTFWTENEMIEAGVGHKAAKDMGHLPQSGEEGMLAKLKEFDQARRILIHINNTNPILDDNSDAHQALTQNGIEVAFDTHPIASFANTGLNALSTTTALQPHQVVSKPG